MRWDSIPPRKNAWFGIADNFKKSGDQPGAVAMMSVMVSRGETVAVHKQRLTVILELTDVRWTDSGNIVFSLKKTSATPGELMVNTMKLSLWINSSRKT